MSATGLPDKPTLRVDEVAIHFGVTPQAVYIWVRKGKVKAQPTPGGGIRILRDSIPGSSSDGSAGGGV